MYLSVKSVKSVVKNSFMIIFGLRAKPALGISAAVDCPDNEEAEITVPHFVGSMLIILPSVTV